MFFFSSVLKLLGFFLVSFLFVCFFLYLSAGVFSLFLLFVFGCSTQAAGDFFLFFLFVLLLHLCTLLVCCSFLAYVPNLLGWGGGGGCLFLSFWGGFST